MIGIFGTDGEDQVEAFCVLPNGEIAVLLSDGEGGRLSLARMSGRAELAVERIDLDGRLVGASLAPAGLDGVYLALTTDASVRLAAFGAGPLPLWERRLERSAAAASPARLLEGDDSAYLVSAHESPGRISLAAFDRDGGQLWQRTFNAAQDGEVYAAALPGGGLLAAFETAWSEAGGEVSLLFLSEAGETRWQADGIPLAGRLAGARPAGEGAELLAAGETVGLVRLDREGVIASPLPVPEAVLNEGVFLEGGAGQSGMVISSYRLSDIQTDVTLTLISEASVSSSERYRLPAGSRISGVEGLGDGVFMIAGSLGEGEAADAFLLILSGQQSAEEVDAPASIPELSVPEAEPGSTEPAGAVSPAAPPASDGQAPAATGGGDAVTCRFSCREGEEVFTLSRSLSADEARNPESLDALHKAACSQLAAIPDERPPVCAP